MGRGPRIRSNLRGVRSALARSLETLSTSTAPRDHIAIGVGQGDDSIVESCLNVGLPARDGLTFTSPGPA